MLPNGSQKAEAAGVAGGSMVIPVTLARSMGKAWKFESAAVAKDL